MRAPTTFKLVCGLHSETPIPKVAQCNGWNRRAALVLDSYVPGLVDAYFDSALFIRFLECIDAAISATRCEVRADVSRVQDTELRSLSEFLEYLRGVPEDDRCPPAEITWFDGNTEIAGGFAEDWFSIGGPEIYHDSFTFSVFSKKDIFPALLAAADEICTNCNAKLLGVYEGVRGN